MHWTLLLSLWLGCKDREATSDTATLSTEDRDGDGFSEADGDCNDDNPGTFPGATEACDGLDQDCDSAVDEDNGRLWYLDADLDGYGDPETSAESCTLEIPGYILEGGDCDDRNAEIHPLATELCDGIDQDCDGEVDDGLISAWYLDADGDGYGDPTQSVEGCEDPGSGYVDNDFDCDDSDPLANDLGLDDCDGRDNDCDGLVDESPEVLWYLDADGDGFGAPGDSLASCSAIEGRSAYDTDCDDSDPSVSPAGVEICDGVDNDCDGGVDVQALDMSTWYLDSDGDGYGLDSDTQQACAQPATYAAEPGDCDDADASVSPGATEWCDGVDNNCDGDTDEDSASDASAWYLDADSDGYGDPSFGRRSCSQPSGYVANLTDCDDSRAESNPGASEVCDLRDNDCNGSVDDAASDASDWYADSDGDGFGDSAVRTASCTAPSGYVADSSDCDDSDGSVGEPATWYSDSDGDGYGDSTGGTSSSCLEPSGYAATDDDCDDSDSSVSPGALEVCDNSVDDDCSGVVDDGCTVDHCGDITADETWESGVDHTVSCRVVVKSSATLTIESGVTVEIDSGAGIAVGETEAGDIVISGGGSVTLTSSASAPAAGDWDGLYLGPYISSASDIAGLSLEYSGGSAAALTVDGSVIDLSDLDISDSGGHGILVKGGAEPEFSQISITDSADDGIYFTTGSGIDTAGGANFEDVTISGSGAYPISIDPSYVEELDSSTNSLTGNTQDYVRLWTATLSQDTTLPLLGVDYHVAGTLAVEGSAYPVLEIQDGVSLYFASGAGLLVGDGDHGGLNADGSTLGILLTSAESSPAYGDWQGVGLMDSYYAGGSTLVGVEIEYAGGSGTGGLTVSSTVTGSELSIHDNDGPGVTVESSGSLKLSDSSIQDNQEQGVYAEGALGSAGSFSGNTISGNGDCAVECYPSAVGSLASDSSYTGNGTDAICLLDGDISSDATWADLGVPYQLNHTLNVYAATAPTWTLEDGVDIEVAAGQRIILGNGLQDGTMVVDGTSSGVSITSAASSPAAGDWMGIYVRQTGPVLDATGLTLSYAGNGSACIYVDKYATVYLDSSSISHCDGDGISLAASGTVLHLSSTSVSDASGYAVYAPNIDYWASNTLTSSDTPLYTYLANVLELDDASSYSGNTNDVVEIGGGILNTAGTIAALDVPYAFQSTVTVKDAITIDDGATLGFETGASMDVSYGSITAVGTSGGGISFTSAQSSPAAGDWGALSFGNGSTGDLEYVTIEYGGGGANGTLVQTAGTVSLDTVAIENSAAYGYYYTGGSRILTSVTYASNASGDTN